MFCCLANPLLFWLLARSIFEDHFALSWRHALLFLTIEALGFIALATSDPSATIARIALQALNLGLVTAALIVAYRGRAPDLVEARRRLRTGLITAAGAYMALVLLIEAFLRGANPHPLASTLNAAAIYTMVLCVAALLTRLNTNLLFATSRAAAADADFDPAARELRARLDNAIAGQALLQDGLTIGMLAQQLGGKEHELRALINAKLGFRNLEGAPYFRTDR
jgi:hypothetical protein